MEIGTSIRAVRWNAGMTQAQVAAAAGTSQTAITAYEKGAKSPSLPTLDRIARAMTTTLRVEFRSLSDEECAERPIGLLSREERRSLWLSRTIAARVQADPGAAMALARRNLQVMRRADERSRGEPWRQAWEELIAGGLDGVLATLCSTSVRACQLRQTAPFAGLLAPKERWAVYISFAKADGEARPA